MIDLILIFILVLGLLRGLKRGLILQFFHFISFFASFFIASFFYQPFSNLIEMYIPYPRLSGEWAFFLDSLPLEAAYYNAIAFALLFFGVKVVLSIISSMLDLVAELPLLSTINGVLGSIFGFLEAYLVLFIVLYIASLLPIEPVQNWLESSSIAAFMVESTPVLSNQLKNLWFSLVIN